jgi:hypothetical protein
VQRTQRGFASAQALCRRPLVPALARSWQRTHASLRRCRRPLCWPLVYEWVARCVLIERAAHIYRYCRVSNTVRRVLWGHSGGGGERGGRGRSCAVHLAGGSVLCLSWGPWARWRRDWRTHVFLGRELPARRGGAPVRVGSRVVCARVADRPASCAVHLIARQRARHDERGNCERGGEGIPETAW